MDEKYEVLIENITSKAAFQSVKVEESLISTSRLFQILEIAQPNDLLVYSVDISGC